MPGPCDLRSEFLSDTVYQKQKYVIKYVIIKPQLRYFLLTSFKAFFYVLLVKKRWIFSCFVFFKLHISK